MKHQKLTKKAAWVVFAIFWLTLAQGLWAQPQPNVYNGGNMFRITGYDDRSPVHQGLPTHLICFSPYVFTGTHIGGYWYALTFPNWNGRYTQEGDLVRMHGDYGYDVGHDHMRFNLATMSYTDEATGDWDEWREDGGFGRTLYWTNIKAVRVGTCPALTTAPLAKAVEQAPPNEGEALDASMNVAPRLLNDGTEAEDPGDPNQESLDEYLARTGQTGLLPPN